MLSSRKQKHSKQCFSWEMGLEADGCPRAAVGCAGLAAHCRIKAGVAFVIKANTKSS